MVRGSLLHAAAVIWHCDALRKCQPKPFSGVLMLTCLGSAWAVLRVHGLCDRAVHTLRPQLQGSLKLETLPSGIHPYMQDTRSATSVLKALQMEQQC